MIKLMIFENGTTYFPNAVTAGLKIFSLGPRILQAILSAVGDVSITQMFAKSMFNSGDNLWIFLSLYTSNWFLLYASSRYYRFELPHLSILMYLPYLLFMKLKAQPNDYDD